MILILEIVSMNESTNEKQKSETPRCGVCGRIPILIRRIRGNDVMCCADHFSDMRPAPSEFVAETPSGVAPALLDDARAALVSRWQSDINIRTVPNWPIDNFEAAVRADERERASRDPQPELSDEDREWMDAPLGPPSMLVPTMLGALYQDALVKARAVARECGYALAVHGSQMRDLDLIAVPWVAEAEPAEVLAERIRAAVKGAWSTGTQTGEWEVPGPHGRRSWAIALSHSTALGDAMAAMKQPSHPYIDLSVMPLAVAAVRAGESPAPQTVEDVLYEWLWATDEGRLDVTWDRYRAAEVVLGLDPCDLCGGCGGCGECAKCEDRDDELFNDGCPKCKTRGVLNTARADELQARLTANRAAAPGSTEEKPL